MTAQRTSVAADPLVGRRSPAACAVRRAAAAVATRLRGGRWGRAAPLAALLLACTAACAGRDAPRSTLFGPGEVRQRSGPLVLELARVDYAKQHVGMRVVVTADPGVTAPLSIAREAILLELEGLEYPLDPRWLAEGDGPPPSIAVDGRAPLALELRFAIGRRMRTRAVLHLRDVRLADGAYVDDVTVAVPVDDVVSESDPRGELPP